MESGLPSRTAQGAALHRAAHQLLDHPQIFADPLALAIIGREAEEELRSGRDWHADPSDLLRAFIAVRSRLAEDTLAEAYQAGVRQYVLLGAGLDTFAYRSGVSLAALRVYEVDHPATQAWKWERLDAAGIRRPEIVRYTAIDFERQSLDDALQAGGFDFARPAVIAWLGVTPYLTHEAVKKTLAFVAEKRARGTSIVFDYPAPADNLDPVQRARAARMAERVAAMGEPFRSSFDPKALAEELRALGFSKVEDFDCAALNARYFSGRSDGLSLVGRGHIMRAQI